VGAVRTHLEFDDDRRYQLTQVAATLFGGLATPGGWSIRGALGIVLDGELDGADGAHDMRTGLAAALGVSRRWTLGDGQWFITGSATLSAATASTEREDDDSATPYTAADLNIGAIAGRTFRTRWSPYLLARAFGGPVWWTIGDEDVTGTDTRHFQLGAGLSVVLPWKLSAVVDVSALGEQSASFGISRQL
jgi:hypothetical protein